MNKEQRGYMTPSEFNKIAKIVQLSIIDKTFYDLNKALNYKARGAVNQGVADTVSKIQEKLDSLYKHSSITFSSGSATLPTDIYKIINIASGDRLKTYEEIKRHEMTYLLSSPLTAPSSKFPVYYQDTAGTDIVALPSPTNGVTAIVDYIKYPNDPRFGYSTDSTYGTQIYDSNTFVSGGVALKPSLTSSLITTTTTLPDGTYTGVSTTGGTGSGFKVNITVVSNNITSCIGSESGTGYSVGDTISILDGGSLTLTSSNLYSSSTYGSTDFELHPSEEPSLIYGILSYAGIIIRDPNITQMASQIIQSNEATKQ